MTGRHTWLLILTLATASSSWGAGFIAGTAPFRRPEGAPTITTYSLAPTTLDQYLRGIEQPVPPNVRQAAESGAWFMPLRHPGMTGPYDWRNRHDTQSSAASR